MISFWPGGQFSSLDLKEEAAIGKLNTERAARVRGFIESDSIIFHTLVVCISSFPRWAYAQGLCSESAPSGVIVGFRRMATALDELLSGSNLFAEHMLKIGTNGCLSHDRLPPSLTLLPLVLSTLPSPFLSFFPIITISRFSLFVFLLCSQSSDTYLLVYTLNCYDRSGELRLAVLGATMTSVLYIHHKDVSYRTLIWDGVRGKVDVDEEKLLSDVLLNKICCGDGGNSEIVRKAFIAAGEEGRLDVAEDVCGVIRKAAVVFKKKNFFTTLDLEGLFSKTRHIALRMPFKVPKLSTIERELFIAEANKRQQSWWDSEANRVYGSARLRRKAESKNPSNWNGFTAYIADMLPI